MTFRHKYSVITVAIVVLLASIYLLIGARNRQEEILQVARQGQSQQDNSVAGQFKTRLEQVKAFSNLEVTHDAGGQTLTLTYTPTLTGEGLDQNLAVSQQTYEELLSRGYSLLVEGGKVAFGLEGITRLTVIEKLPQAASGLQTATEAMRISISKEAFSSVDWESLRGKPIHPTVQKVASAYSIDPAVARSVRNANLLVLPY